MYTGSMVGAGADVFAIWPYLLANMDQDGLVRVNLTLLPLIMGMTVESINNALDYLQQPDPFSKSPDEDGRRLKKLGGMDYLVVNAKYYNKIRKAEDRRQQLKDAQQRQRDKVKLMTYDDASSTIISKDDASSESAHITITEPITKTEPLTEPKGVSNGQIPQDEETEQSPTVTQALDPNAGLPVLPANSDEAVPVIQGMYNAIKKVLPWNITGEYMTLIKHNLEAIPTYSVDMVKTITYVRLKHYPDKDKIPGMPLLIKHPEVVEQHARLYDRMVMEDEAPPPPPKHVPLPSQFTPEIMSAARAAKEQRRAEAQIKANRLKGIF